MKVIAEFCDKYNITYEIGYGTALGAYRLKSFIPWDDDADLVMPREDYERFIRMFSRYGPSGYYIQSVDKDKRYYHPFIKVMKENTLFLEEKSVGVLDNNGIYVDIFPLDHVKKNSLPFRTNFYFLKFLKHAVCVKETREFLKRRKKSIRYYLDFLSMIPVVFISNKRILRYINLRMRGKEEDLFFFDYNTIYGIDRDLMNKSVLFPPSTLTINGESFYAPHDIKTYLSTVYGKDYMVLPPVEKRRSHKPVSIKFESN